MKVLDDLTNKKETLWINPDLQPIQVMSEINGQKFFKIKAAQNRLLRFMPYFASAFPETASRRGVIESELLEIPDFTKWVRDNIADIEGRILLKDDAHLPIAGSVKARGGIHEVLCIAEKLAIRAGMLATTDNYAKLDSDEFREFYGQYTIQVGSTGNLGLSIGITSAKLGFKVIVHMSRDAKQWKKDMLREVGVEVIEYDTDYSEAVAAGRKKSEDDPNSFFIDDEKSEDLFMGYATAALRLKVQLYKKGIAVDEQHPLFVYIPCGVGGAPGGITFGLKELFGEYVHCFFAEPVEAPCMTLGLASGKCSDISAFDIGLSGKTIADGLAVMRPSELACKMAVPTVSGTFTVSDDKLITYQKAMLDTQGIYLEPSACAGIHGLAVQSEADYEEYIDTWVGKINMPNATHIIWATGGGLAYDKSGNIRS